MRKLAKIFYYPIELDGDRYVALQQDVLRSLSDAIVPITHETIWRHHSARRATVAVLNWYEDQMAWRSSWHARILGMAIVRLILLRVLCRKVVWVRHNLWPHGVPRPFLRQSIMLCAMRLLTTDVVAHRALAACPRTIPVRLYFEGPVPPGVRDIDHLYFGRIKRYKGLTELLSAWPCERPLLIAGEVADETVYAELRHIVSSRQLDVAFRTEYLTEDELNALLLRTRFVVLPHHDDAMIVSGALFHAIALGCNILARDGDFGRGIKRMFGFINIYTPDAIAHSISTATEVDPQEIVRAAHAHNSREQCRLAWQRVLFETSIPTNSP